jgi:hypothetical protein
MSDLLNSITESVGINEIFTEMIEFINDQISDDDRDDEDERYPETRVKEFIEEITEFLLDCFEERVEFMLFFKTCFINFDLTLKDFRDTLFALGQAFKNFEDYQEPEDEKDGNGDNGGDDDNDY